MEKVFYVYILTNKPYGTLYVGVTSNLIRRVWDHKELFLRSFTNKYNIKKLVYYEAHGSAHTAIPREKRLKDWKRQWKIDLINQFNPNWDDFYMIVLSNLEMP